MTDTDTAIAEKEASGWRLRPAILAILGVIAAVAVQQLVDPHRPSNAVWEAMPVWRIALSIAIWTAALAIGFGMERTRLLWAVVFALLIGGVTGFIYYWSGGAGGAGANWLWDWRYASLFLSVVIAVPLFQTARDEGGWRFPYAEVHGHAWTNVVLWCACWVFTGIAFLLAWLLASLFDLIGLHFLSELLGREWFGAGLVGAAFGGALGLLRERDRVVRLLQRVVTAVLAVLAPVLGAGLLLFLLALPFTGLRALWDATKSTTPILLSCVVGALILSNAVIGNGEDEEISNPVLRGGAMALGLAALPLCIIAAIATGLRIGQYGFTPDRLWALIFVILATVYGVAYFGSLMLGRSGWAARIRPANLRVAFVVAIVSLFLATPILSFNAISTRDQVARLESGRIKPDKFDWAALAFDFGDPGKAALKRLAASKNADFASRARDAASKTSRYEVASVDTDVQAADALVKRLRVLPAAIAVPLKLRTLLISWDACGTADKGNCTLLYTPNGHEAIAMRDECISWKGDSSPPAAFNPSTCDPIRYHLDGDDWKQGGTPYDASWTDEQKAALKAGLAAGKVEIRPVPSRRLFIGGVPIGEPFE